MSNVVGRDAFFASRSQPRVKHIEVDGFGTVIIRKLSAEYVLDTATDTAKVKDNTCRMLIDAVVDGDLQPIFQDNEESRQAILSMDWDIIEAITKEITAFSGFSKEKIEESKKNSETVPNIFSATA